MMARLSCTNAMTSASELAVHKVQYSKANAKMTCISGIGSFPITKVPQ